MILLLFGAPGAGKGTLAEMLTKHYKLPHVSTGDLLRYHLSKGTEIGTKAKEYMDAGLLVPDDVVLEILEEKMLEKACHGGYILDGFPRTVEQAEALDEMMEERSVKISHVFNIDVPQAVIVKRLCARRVCSKCGTIYNVEFKPPKKEGVCDVCGAPLMHRSDDKDDVIRKRLAEYESKTRPVLDYYQKKNLVRTVKGTDSVEMFGKIVDIVGK